MQRIGIIADSREPTSKEYPGHGLGKAALNFMDVFTKSGYDVVYFAHPDSYHKYAHLVPCHSEKELYEKAKDEDLDVVLDLSHKHSFQEISDIPVVNLSVDREHAPGINPVFQSKAHRDYWKKPTAPIVTNAVDVLDYEFISRPEDFMLYMAPMIPPKGFKTALFTAFVTQLPLVLAGKYTERFPNGLGALSGEKKLGFLSHASMLLFPSPHEAGTITPLEAMASGTPVVCYDYGAAGEYVENGKTGFCVKTQEEFIDAVYKIDSIDRAYCREYVKKNFSKTKTGKEMLALLERASLGETWTGKDYNGST